MIDCIATDYKATKWSCKKPLLNEAPDFKYLMCLFVAATGFCIMLAGLVVLSQGNSKQYYWAPINDPNYLRFLNSDFHLFVGKFAIVFPWN